MCSRQYLEKQSAVLGVILLRSPGICPRHHFEKHSAVLGVVFFAGSPGICPRHYFDKQSAVLGVVFFSGLLGFVPVSISRNNWALTKSSQQTILADSACHS